MKKSEYLQRAFELLNDNKISEEVYDAMIMNSEVFCEEDEEEYGLPHTYAELEYSSERLFSDPEAIDGAKWDDMNYIHYMER